MTKWAASIALCTAAMACAHSSTASGSDAMRAILARPIASGSRILANDPERFQTSDRDGNGASLTRRKRRSRLECCSGATVAADVLQAFAVEAVALSHRAARYGSGDYLSSGRSPPVLAS